MTFLNTVDHVSVFDKSEIYPSDKHNTSHLSPLIFARCGAARRVVNLVLCLPLHPRNNLLGRFRLIYDQRGRFSSFIIFILPVTPRLLSQPFYLVCNSILHQTFRLVRRQTKARLVIFLFLSYCLHHHWGTVQFVGAHVVV